MPVSVNLSAGIKSIRALLLLIIAPIMNGSQQEDIPMITHEALVAADLNTLSQMFVHAEKDKDWRAIELQVQIRIAQNLLKIEDIMFQTASGPAR